MKKKYQIFVSSTFEDLKEERDLVMKAILEMGHIPVGMEMFSAGDDEQWKLIQTQIDDCDYYIVICAFRYGSLDNDIGYTEKEYDYAVSKKLPALGFIIHHDANWPANRVDNVPESADRLISFKSKVQSKLVSYWKDKNDLYGKVSIALMKQFNTNPRDGWIKSSEQTNPEVLNEVSRLSKENSELRKEIKRYEEELDIEKKEDFLKTLNTLKHNKREIHFSYLNEKGWKNPTEYTLFQIFDIIAPFLMNENTTKYCSKSLGSALNPDRNKNVRLDWPTPSNTIRRILADLNVLEIIHPSTKKHSIKDDNEYWTLTENGKKLFKEIRRDVLEKNLKISLNSENLENET